MLKSQGPHILDSWTANEVKYNAAKYLKTTAELNLYLKD